MSKTKKSKNKFWMRKKEKKFFLSHIEESHRVLEWGSGKSTLYLQDKVKKLISIEHDPKWYDELKDKLKESVEYILATPNIPEWENQFSIVGEDEHGNTQIDKNIKSDDGSFEDFCNYVAAPLLAQRMGAISDEKFDIIFIDGRARVACAFMSMFLLKPEGKIFIHDFGPEVNHPTLPYRVYYDLVNNFLEPVDNVKSMYMFKVRS